MSEIDPSDTAELAGAPLELVLTDAARGNWRRMVPSAGVTKLVRGLANRPLKVAGRARGLAGEYARIAVGSSHVEPDPRDKRFADPAWSGNPLLKRSLQTFLATSHVAEALVEDARLDEPDRLRMHTVVSNLADALAPSNNPLLNPRALKALVDTGGSNFVDGGRRLLNDVAQPPRVPSMVDPDSFVVGETVAATPGTVVLRTDVLEVLRYTPTTDKVREIPLLIIPPTINKYYVTDLAPGRSLVQYLVEQGHQVFTISWRNPDVRHARWGFDIYGRAILDAIDAARTAADAPSVAMLSLCSGGVLSSLVLGHLAAVGELDKVAAAAMSVAVLDQADAGVTGALLTPQAADAAVRASAARGFLDGRSLAEVFAWLRPNDLIWNYWVDSYLLGNAPKPFDVLFWNADTTRMAARLHRDFIHLAQRNSLTKPGDAVMLGTPIDLSQVHLDTYVTAGISDHLCPWQKCYQSTQLFGGKSRFVLSTSGHVASIVNPPGNKRANFRTAEHNPPSAAAWIAEAESVEGSWWPDFSTWLHARTGDQVAVPDPSHPTPSRHELNGAANLGPAPGTYVHIK